MQTSTTGQSRSVPIETRRVLLAEDSSVVGKLFNLVSMLDKSDALGIFSTEEPETILQEASLLLGAQFGDTAASKLLMGVTAYSTDLVYKDCRAFIDFANICSASGPIRPDIYDPANVLECAIAVVEMAVMDAALEGDDPNSTEYSEEIRKYWGAMLLSEGFIEPFAPLFKAIMPGSDRDVATQAMGEYLLQSDGEARVQIDASIQIYFQKIYKEISHLYVDGKPALSMRELKQIAQSIGV